MSQFQIYTILQRTSWLIGQLTPWTRISQNALHSPLTTHGQRTQWASIQIVWSAGYFAKSSLVQVIFPTQTPDHFICSPSCFVTLGEIVCFIYWMSSTRRHTKLRCMVLGPPAWPSPLSCFILHLQLPQSISILPHCHQDEKKRNSANAGCDFPNQTIFAAWPWACLNSDLNISLSFCLPLCPLLYPPLLSSADFQR